MSLELKFEMTRVFLETYESETRITVNEGGSRSSKTYSLCQLFIDKMIRERNIVISVVRKTLPSLKASAMKDFFDILKEKNIYNEIYHNKSENTYRIGNNEIEFISVDQPQKIRGRKRDYLWINEANELMLEDFRQLNMRTTQKVYLDYNPSEMVSWIYDEILTRKDVTKIHSTYLDNPFLEQAIIKEIERFKETDENFWRIYGLGLRGISMALIYSNWSLCNEMPEDAESVYGLDFGYNHKTALIDVANKDDDFYLDQVIYQSYLTNSDLIQLMIDKGVDKKKIIYADCAEPQRIQEIRNAGFNVKPAFKGASSVKNGIDFIKAHKVLVTKSSKGINKEKDNYRWKTKDDIVLDEPIKILDDAMDGARYPIYTHWGIQREWIGFA